MIETIDGLSLPSDKSLRRDPPPNCQVLNDSFWDRYDSKTLFYGCLQIAHKGILRLYLPKPFNLAPLVKGAKFTAQGQTLRIQKWRKDRHFDQLDLKAPPDVDELQINFGSFQEKIVVYQQDVSLSGLSVVYTNSKNNDLQWIADWAKFHVRNQGANAVVLSDNLSDRYAPEEILKKLTSVEGLRAIKVVRNPYKFGTLAPDCTNFTDGKFMQSAIMTFLRDRFMSRARGILNVDIDELCVSRSGRTIFDAAANSRLGYITFPGTWHYPEPGKEPVRHMHHSLVDPNDKPCPTKYVIDPTKPLGTLPMRVHQLGFAGRHLFQRRKEFHFLHCRRISTSWKVDRTTEDRSNLITDHRVQQLLQETFAT